MRLIDGDALRGVMYHEAFETDSDMQRWDSGCWIRYKMFENAIDNAPTIDAVPVIRCAECVHGYRYFEAYGLDCLSCRKLVDKNGNGIEFPVLPDGYCSQGQLREDGAT